MKKTTAWMLILAALVFLAPANAYAAGDSDTWGDQISDWVATVGHPADERETILAQRRAKRAVARLEKALASSAESARKGMDKFGKDLNKQLAGTQ